jgi:hypothetical protein
MVESWVGRLGCGCARKAATGAFCNGFDEPGLLQPFATGCPAREARRTANNATRLNAVVHPRIN